MNYRIAWRPLGFSLLETLAFVIALTLFASLAMSQLERVHQAIGSSKKPPSSVDLNSKQPLTP